MTSREDAEYRLRLARGFLERARQDHGRQEFDRCADGAQRAGENAAKALITLIEPPPKTHAPKTRLAELIDAGALRLPAGVSATELLAMIELLGSELHIEAGYGVESARLAPWEAIDRPRAEAALAAAERVVALAERIVTPAGASG